MNTCIDRWPRRSQSQQEYPETDYWRPRTRGDCATFDRPCPYVGCKFSLYLDVSPTSGAIKLNFPDLEPWEMVCSCVLDVTDGGPLQLERVGELTNVTGEWIRRLEVVALRRMQLRGRDLRELIPGAYPDLIVPGTPKPRPVFDATEADHGPGTPPEPQQEARQMSILEVAKQMEQQIPIRLKEIESEITDLTDERKRLVKLQRVLSVGAGGGLAWASASRWRSRASP